MKPQNINVSVGKYNTLIHISTYAKKMGVTFLVEIIKIEVSRAWARPARFNLWEKARPEGHTKSY